MHNRIPTTVRFLLLAALTLALLGAPGASARRRPAPLSCPR